MSFLKISNLSKTFSNGSGVFDININIAKGELVGFVGDNGAGKTTTIKLIFGELKKDTGELTLNGTEIRTKESLRKIAFFPDHNNFPKNFTISQYASYCGKLKNLSNAEIHKYLDLYLRSLNLEKFKDSRFSELSAGMQKRAILLSTIITNPEIIISDEPTDNLDVHSRLEFLNVLSHFAKVHNKTIIITSHNIDELSNIINRVVIIEKFENLGQVIYDDKFNPELDNLRDIYIKYSKHNKIKNIDFDQIIEIENIKIDLSKEDIVQQNSLLTSFSCKFPIFGEFTIHC